MNFNEVAAFDKGTVVNGLSFFVLFLTFQFSTYYKYARYEFTSNTVYRVKEDCYMLFNGLHLMKSLVFLVITCKVFEFDSKRIPDEAPKVLEAQIHKSNTPTESGSDYFQRAIIIPLL